MTAARRAALRAPAARGLPPESRPRLRRSASEWRPTRAGAAAGRGRRRAGANSTDAIDAPVDHDRDTLGDRGRDADVLLDDEDGDIAFRAEPDQHLLDLRDDDRREALGRLVHDEEMRIGDERAGRSPASAARRRRADRRRCFSARRGAGRHRRRVRPSRSPSARRDHAQMLVDGQRSPQAAALRHVADAAPRDLRRRKADQLLAAHSDRAARGARQGP